MATVVKPTLQRITPAVGAVIGGVDLAEPMEAETVGFIRQAVTEHGVVFFRDQDATIEQQWSFLKNFGTPWKEDSFGSDDDRPDDVKESDLSPTRKGTAVWHTDSSFLATPPKFTLLRAVKLPGGYTVDFAGEAKELAKTQKEMGVVFGLSLAVIFLAIVFQFASVAKSLVVMATVPLGLIGAFAGIVLFQTNLGFMGFLAIVSLAGVIVSHIIVLSDYIEEARAEGMPLREALVHAGLVRLRPVLVTVLATVCGLIPLADKGGELWRPLTAVHIVGLLCATALTLVVLPVIYLVFAEKLKWIDRDEAVPVPAANLDPKAAHPLAS